MLFRSVVEDSWIGFGNKPLPVHYYIRPLKEYINPILEVDWKVCSIDEPLPSIALKETHLELFKKLSNSPIFLFYTLIK